MSCEYEEGLGNYEFLGYKWECCEKKNVRVLWVDKFILIFNNLIMLIFFLL